MTSPAAEQPLLALRSLAAVAGAAAMAPVGGLNIAEDGQLGIVGSPRNLDLGFIAEGVAYQFQVIADGDDRVCRLSSEIGFVPYSAQNREGRRAVLIILDAARSLKTVRFELANGQAIRLQAETRIEGVFTKGQLFLTILRLLQEARPYVRLLSQHL